MNQRKEYLLDHAWQKERERLATIERWVDPWTTRCLRSEAPDFRAMTPILFAAWGRKP
jgi:hypothetical protein